ncbi:MAG: RNA methyltransferase [Candidatus Omnitrophota bacterium]|nr:RNA methyltransferase [Candidatus Omnitrophota bacterium]
MRLYGKNPVIERIRSNPGSIKKLCLQKQAELSDVVREIKKAGLNFESLEKKEFKEICADIHAQGVFAEVEEFLYTGFDAMVKECLGERTVPVFLDGITDPQNLGSIIRTLACLGGFSVVLPEHDSADITETVLRVANGGENYTKIAKVTNIATAIRSVKSLGIRVIGADMSGKDLSVPGSLPKGAMALVVGSEGKGIRPGVLSILDGTIRIPMEGAELSYNAAIAAAILCYEVKKQR